MANGIAHAVKRRDVFAWRPRPFAGPQAPEPRLNKGETVIDAIARLRLRVRELLADAHRIKSAPYPSAHAKARASQQVEELAQRGAVSVSRQT
jgi:hypothetical protein